MTSPEFEAGRRLGFVENELERAVNDLRDKKDLEDKELFKKLTSAYGEYLTIASEHEVEAYEIKKVSDKYRTILSHFKIESPDDNLPF